MGSRMKKRYTLIELLVVLSIIGVLMSLLMTVLVKVEDQVDLSECTVKLKDMSSALNMYIADNKQYLTTKQQWHIQLDWYIRPEIKHKHYYPSDYDDMDQYDDTLWDPYYCPAADPKRERSNGTFNQYIKGSYSHNSTAGFTDQIPNPYDPRLKLSQIPRPGEKLIIIDGGGTSFFNAGALYSSKYPQLFENQDGIAGWKRDCVRVSHFDATNCLFLDGHIELLELQGGKYGDYGMADLTAQ